MSHRATKLLALGAAVVLVLCAVPLTAEACAVCGTTPERSKTAFIITTALLSALPLLMLGGLAYWIRKRLHTIELEAESAER